MGIVAGISGKYGAGKNLAASVFEERGFLVIDVDRLGHGALESKKNEVVAAFGPSVLTRSGTVDRKALGRIVFSDPLELARLESITHPEMKAEVAGIIEANPGRNVCINAALLYRMGLHELCSFVIWVTAPFVTRLVRAMKRDNLSVSEAFVRLVRQKKLRPQYSSRFVDMYTVTNSGDPGKLKTAVGEILSGRGL